MAAVLHQPELARHHADRIVGLRDGRTVFSGPAGEIPQEQISALYVADEPAGTVLTPSM
ncbi:hypothetical protein GCM10022252_62790 [Streptosporangium oxazolinicum]|uniref:Uncharacterized protein n=1 Tax=Streptosporangium oxazolinicum TaxID=909287 RepID=A0ABP8BD91_9ACTN